MDTNLIFGLIGVASFGFSIWTYFKGESKKKIEAVKAARQQERLQSTQEQMLALLNTIDSIVQLPKANKVSIPVMQDMARAARGQAYHVLNQIKQDREVMQNWRFGEWIQSQQNPPVTDAKNKKSS